LSKDIKPLVDASYHTEAIELSYHQSPIEFPLLLYQNARYQFTPQSGQAILFGCPLELHMDGQLNKVPPILQYLFDSIEDTRHFKAEDCSYLVSQKKKFEQTSHSGKTQKYWDQVNELEQAWSGVEEKDRALVLKHDKPTCVALLMVGGVPRHHCRT
jgi:hypothetical protein